MPPPHVHYRDAETFRVPPDVPLTANRLTRGHDDPVGGYPSA